MPDISQLVDDSFLRLPADKASAILAAARAEFSEQGFAAASTNRIVQAAGIAKGSLFNYFRDKAALFLYLHYRCALDQLAVFRQHRARIQAGRDAVDRLRLAVELSLAQYERDPAAYRFSLTLAGADAEALVPRYAALFDPADSRELFRDLMTPPGSGDSPALAQTLQWLLAGIKLELQACLRRRLSPAEIRDQLLARIELIRSVLKAGPHTGQDNGSTKEA